MLWANLHLLFWLSLFPFATGWMGENHFAPLPSAFYGVALLMAACRLLDPAADDHRRAGPQSILKAAVGGDWKGKLSPVLYLVAIASTFFVLLGRTGALCRGGPDVAGSGPPHRAGVAYAWNASNAEAHRKPTLSPPRSSQTDLLGARQGAADERTTEPHDRLVP